MEAKTIKNLKTIAFSAIGVLFAFSAIYAYKAIFVPKDKIFGETLTELYSGLSPKMGTQEALLAKPGLSLSYSTKSEPNSGINRLISGPGEAKLEIYKSPEHIIGRDGDLELTFINDRLFEASFSSVAENDGEALFEELASKIKSDYGKSKDSSYDGARSEVWEYGNLVIKLSYEYSDKKVWLIANTWPF